MRRGRVAACALAVVLTFFVGMEAAERPSPLRKPTSKTSVKHSAERADYREEVVEATTATGHKLKWRSARVVNHEEPADGSVESSAPRVLPTAGGMRSVLTAKQSDNAKPKSFSGAPLAQSSQSTAPPASGGRSPSSTGANTQPGNNFRVPTSNDNLEPPAEAPAQDPSFNPFDGPRGSVTEELNTPAPAAPFNQPTAPGPNRFQPPRDPAEIDDAPDPFGDGPGRMPNTETDRDLGTTIPSPADAYGNQQQRRPLTADSCRDNEECREALAALKESSLADIGLDITVTGAEGDDFPCECPLGEGEQLAPRLWASTIFTWKASGLCHKPLYFEEVHLERYGHSWGPYLDPAISAAHFFTAIPLLPYKMGLEPPNECIYTLGYYRPGNCAPYLLDPIPFSARGALFQAGAVVGVGAIVP